MEIMKHKSEIKDYMYQLIKISAEAYVKHLEFCTKDPIVLLFVCFFHTI